MKTHWITKRIRSFKHAFAGFSILLKNEPNATIHIFLAIMVIFLSFHLGLSNLEWVAILLSIGFVLTTEIINTAIEAISDFVSPEYHQKIKIIKDLAAASVLMASITALLVGIIILYPKISSLL